MLLSLSAGVKAGLSILGFPWPALVSPYRYTGGALAPGSENQYLEGDSSAHQLCELGKLLLETVSLSQDFSPWALLTF